MNLAKATIGERGTENGYDKGQERSAEKVAQVFNALTGHQLKESDVWTLLIVLKLVRNERQYKLDNIVDLIGYSGLLGECLDRNSEELTEFHQAVISQVENLAASAAEPVEPAKKTLRCNGCARPVCHPHHPSCPLTLTPGCVREDQC